jgi:hypothetical protein
MQVESGIDNTERESHPICSHDAFNANSVVSPSKPKTTDASDTIALEHVRQNGDETIKSITSQKHAAFAVNHSATVNTRTELPVRIPVSASKCLSVQRTGRTEPVYNLATSDGTVVVNGLLSKNCDSLRYGLFTYHGLLGATIDSHKRLNRDSAIAEDTDIFSAPTPRLSQLSTAHRKT